MALIFSMFKTLVGRLKHSLQESSDNFHSAYDVSAMIDSSSITPISNTDVRQFIIDAVKLNQLSSGRG